jgi:hypothetical protein
MTCPSILFAIMRFITSLQRSLLSVLPVPLRVHTRYLISNDAEYDDALTRVPEGSVFVEEYTADGVTKRRVLYEGDEIAFYTEDPFKPATAPWVWIGDKTSEIDLTYALSKYIVPGNVIDLDLIFTMLHVNRDTEIVYIDPRSLEEVKFPGEGVRIHAAA